MNILLESTITDILNKVQTNDVIYISYDVNKKLSFKVIDSINGRIKMTAINIAALSDNIFFITKLSLVKDSLLFSYIDKNNLKPIEVLNDANTWQGKRTIKNLINIEILRNNIVVDELDPFVTINKNTNSKTTANDEYLDFVNNILRMLSEANINDGFKITLSDNTRLSLLKLSNDVFSIDNKKTYKFLIKSPITDDDVGDLVTFNSDIVSINGSSSFNLTFKKMNGGNTIIENIKSIVNFKVVAEKDRVDADINKEKAFVKYITKQLQILNNATIHTDIIITLSNDTIVTLVKIGDDEFYMNNEKLSIKFPTLKDDPDFLKLNSDILSVDMSASSFNLIFKNDKGGDTTIENKTEREIMIERKIYRIYDCGTKRYSLTITK